MKTIAIIEDDQHISGILNELLTREGYRVIHAYSGTEAVMLAERERPDLYLLDLMLPGIPGEELLHSLNAPIIILSSKSDPHEKAVLLRAGAVDYVVKPFDTEELLARIALRIESAPRFDDSRITAGELTLDADSRIVSAPSGECKLTRTEAAILKLLMLNQSRVVTRSLLLDRISLDTPDCTESSLKMHISNLRRKLRDVTGRDLIEAVWGIGFKLNL